MCPPLYTSNHSHNVQAGWATDPEGLRFTMVDRKPAAFQNNPVWENNEPHAAGDLCGSGGSHGIENQWVSYALWQSTFLTGCAYDSADGSLQFISVCDPESPKIGVPRRVEPVRYFNGRSLIAVRDAVKGVTQDLKRFGLATAKQTSRVARGRFTTPYLVERLDAENRFYYLVPSTEGGNVIGWAQVDARFGNLESLYALKRPLKPFDLEASRVAKRVVGRKIELPREDGRFELAAGKFSVERRLVWKPCRESFSPHLPFWRITAGPFRFYARIDGPVFAQLTTEGRGV